MKSSLTAVFFISFFLFACKKDSEKDIITIQGFKLTDNLGNQFGVNGNADDDWKLRNWTELSAREQAFLGFADNVTLSNTTTATIGEPVAYPNPCSSASIVYFNSSDSVKLKVALVDSRGTVYRTHAMKIKGGQNIAFDVSNRSEIPSGKSLRYYYSFSLASQEHFKAGYGDIKVCDEASPFTGCF
ncbi:MAG: hypothetical protein JNM88_13945 [Chitinophagaceae bacterium]|nr:hypothetical protein [Chitinophagaceae bacterium]